MPDIAPSFRMTLFKSLYDTYYIDVARYVQYMLNNKGVSVSDADDIVQEVFLEAYTNLESLSTHTNPKAWLIKTAKFKCYNLIRGKRLWQQQELFDDNKLADETVDIESLVLAVNSYDYNKILEQIKGELSIEDYLLYEQVYQQRIPQVQLAKYYHISYDALRMRVCRVRKLIVNILSKILVIIVTIAISTHI